MKRQYALSGIYSGIKELARVYKYGVSAYSEIQTEGNLNVPSFSNGESLIDKIQSREITTEKPKYITIDWLRTAHESATVNGGNTEIKFVPAESPPEYPAKSTDSIRFITTINYEDGTAKLYNDYLEHGNVTLRIELGGSEPLQSWSVIPALGREGMSELRDQMSSIAATASKAVEIDETTFLSENQAFCITARKKGLSDDKIGEKILGIDPSTVATHCERGREKRQEALEKLSLSERTLRYLTD